MALSIASGLSSLYTCTVYDGIEDLLNCMVLTLRLVS